MNAEQQKLNDLWQVVATSRKRATEYSLAGRPGLANFYLRASLRAQREIRRICHAALATLPSIG